MTSQRSGIGADDVYVSKMWYYNDETEQEVIRNNVAIFERISVEIIIFLSDF